MVIITLLCTVSLTLGQKDAIRFNYPLDAYYEFEDKIFEFIEKGKVEKTANTYAASLSK